MGNAEQYKELLKLHEKYGEFLRIGSSDLAITHPEGVNAVYGLGTKCTKACSYDMDAPNLSMHSTRSRAFHDKRRRIWSPAFSDKALRGYEERIKHYGDTLVNQLAAFSGKPVNASSWFTFFGFDVMGDLAFGESFNMLESGQEHFAIRLLNAGMDPMYLALPPWAFRFLTHIPGLAADYWKFIKYCGEQLDLRIKKSVHIPDIMSALLQPHSKTSSTPTGKDLEYLRGDSRLIIVAGSDTTSATLTYLFYHLLQDQSRIQRLREELSPHVSATGQVSHRDIQDAPYLNGCINEALRLNPPVPSSVPRMTPPEGIHVGETFVPGGMTVWCPQYAIGRNPNIYPSPTLFLPERWSTTPPNPSLLLSKSSFAPFSAGVYGCIGKPLALMEIRTVVAKLITRFEIDYAPGETGWDLMNKTRDHFTLGLGDLRLVFREREGGKVGV